MRKTSLLLSTLILLGNYLFLVFGHGRILDPPGRGSMWRFGFDVPPNYNDNSNYCGGIDRQWGKNKGKCGVCGDAYDDEPREHEPGGKYATGLIGKSYTEGSRVKFIVEITANHLGYFEFRLCVNDDPFKKVEQDCFDENLLEVLNNEQEETNKYAFASRHLKYYVPNSRNDNYTIELKLPDGVTCKQCIIQWRYHAGNNYGKSFSGSTCLGCAEKQEEFYNCADISIEIDRNKPDSNQFSIANTTAYLPLSCSITNYPLLSLYFVIVAFYF